MTLPDQMKEIAALKLGALRAKFTAVTGRETKSNNRPFLIKKISEALRAAPPPAPPPAEKSKRRAPEAKRKPAPAGKPRAPRVAPSARDPRLPAPGQTLEREYNGRTIQVKVLEQGFEYRGEVYRSLSTVAKRATGTIWNGFLFFGLTPYPKRKAGTKGDAGKAASP